jgi:hypothetical protein
LGRACAKQGKFKKAERAHWRALGLWLYLGLFRNFSSGFDSNLRGLDEALAKQGVGRLTSLRRLRRFFKTRFVEEEERRRDPVASGSLPPTEHGAILDERSSPRGLEGKSRIGVTPSYASVVAASTPHTITRFEGPPPSRTGSKQGKQVLEAAEAVGASRKTVPTDEADVVGGLGKRRGDMKDAVFGQDTNSSVATIGASADSEGIPWAAPSSSHPQTGPFKESRSGVGCFASRDKGFDTDIYYFLATGKDHLVLLYDTSNKIGWYLPLVSVVLHMVHAAISMGGYKIYDGDKELCKEECTEFSKVTYGDWGTASQVIKHRLGWKVRKYYSPDTRPVEESFADVIRTVWFTLDKVEAVLASREVDFRMTNTSAPQYIHGVEWLDVARMKCPSQITIKKAKFDQAWSYLTSREPTVIFYENIPPPINLCPLTLHGEWTSILRDQQCLVLTASALRLQAIFLTKLKTRDLSEAFFFDHFS